MFTSEKAEAVNYKNNLWESIRNKQIICKSLPIEIDITVPLSNLYPNTRTLLGVYDGNADNENCDIIREKRDNYRNINLSARKKICKNITVNDHGIVPQKGT